MTEAIQAKMPQEKDHLLDLECLHCCLKQIIEAPRLKDMDEARRREIAGEALQTLARGDLKRYAFEIIEECYRVVTRGIGDENPYREIKAYYNREMLKLVPALKRHIAESDDPLRAAVRVAVAGNLIDLGAFGNDFTLDSVLEKVETVDQTGLYYDDVDELRAALEKAKRVLVLGDNCGEIVLDRVMIETIRELYPQLHVQFGVRGRSIVNDVTYEDAEMVHMADCAEVIDNGDGVLATLLNRTSPEFQQAFRDADVVLAKGMGNIEGLFECGKENLWFLLIAKCGVIAKLTRAPKGAILCMQGSRHEFG